jgi:SHAQKYF class myb-like DNA-binding protein
MKREGNRSKNPNTREVNTNGSNTESPSKRRSSRARRNVNYSYPSISSYQQGYFSATGKEKANVGRWTADEHIKFCQGLKIHGKNWKLVERHVVTRSGPQIRSHAQKFF